MSAYAVALVKVKNPEKMQEYQKIAGPTFGKFGGELAAKGKVTGLLAGQSDLNVVAVMKFPSLEKIDEWYGSEDYQAAVAVREEACDMTILKLQEPPVA